MASLYPIQIDTVITLPTATDNFSAVRGITVNQLRDAIIYIESELGIKPSATYGTVRARLDAITAISGGGVAGGDLSGTYPNPTVVGLHGFPVSGLIPTDGYVLTWSNSQDAWLSKQISIVGILAGGDLSGTYPNPSVSRINGATVPIAGSLTIGNVLQVSGAGSLTYAPLNLAGGSNYISGILPIGNQANQVLGGDLTGTTASARVEGIKTVPISGSDGYGIIGSVPAYNQVGGSSYKLKKPTPPNWFDVSDYNILSTNSSSVNSINLQNLINTATPIAGQAVVIYFPEHNINLATNLILTRVVTLKGVAGGQVAFPGIYDYNGSCITFDAGTGIIAQDSVAGMPYIGALCDGAKIEDMCIIGTPIYGSLGTWAATTSYSVGNLIKVRNHNAPFNIRENRYYMQCIVGGNTGSSEPNWQLNYIPDFTVLWSTLPSSTNAVRLGTTVRSLSTSTTVFWECTTSGTKGGTEPNWSTALTPDVSTITDNTVVWTARASAGQWLTDGYVVWSCQVHAGLHVRAPSIHLVNSRITNFTNSGIHIQAQQSHPALNANLGHFQTSTIDGCGVGITVRGSDSNQNTFEGIRVVNTGQLWDGTGGVGIWDGSFLGNYYSGCLVEAGTGAGYVMGKYDWDATTAPIGSVLADCYAEGDTLISHGYRGLLLGGNFGSGFTQEGITFLQVPGTGSLGLYEQDVTGPKNGFFYLDSQGSDGFAWHSNNDNLGPGTWFGTQYQMSALGRTGWWSNSYGQQIAGASFSGGTASEGWGWDWQPLGMFKGGNNGSFGGQYFKGYDISSLYSSRVRLNGHYHLGDKLELSDGYNYVVTKDGYRASFQWAPNIACSAGFLSPFENIQQSTVEPSTSARPVPTQGTKVFACITSGTTNSNPLNEPNWNSVSTPGQTITETAPSTIVWQYLGNVPNYAYGQFITHTPVLGAAQDGYILTYVNADGYFEAKPSTVSAATITPGTAGQVLITNSTPTTTWTTLSQDATVSATGAITNVGIRTKSLNASLATIGASQDGYVLTWDNTDGYWLAKAIPIGLPTITTNGFVLSIVGGVATWTQQIPHQYEISFVAGIQSTNTSTFSRIGARKLDMSVFPTTVGALNRTVTLICDIQKTSGATSVEVQLFDVTNNVQVTSTDIVYSTDNSLTEQVSSTLTVGSSSGNIRSDSPAMLEFDLKMNGGSIGIDSVFCNNARILISYA